MSDTLVFRWSAWGQWNEDSISMLIDSVESFHGYFPKAAYILSHVQSCSEFQKGNLPRYLQLHTLPAKTGIETGHELWLKWFPQDITDEAAKVVIVDADVFCVNEPACLREWLEAEDSTQICCMQESKPEPWCYGNFYDKLGTLPRVNAGFVATKRPAHLMHTMMRKYQHYKSWIVRQEPKWHDEQGALAEYWLEQNNLGTASYLPEDRNRLLCPSANSDTSSIIDLEIVHTPYPDHPKYFELKDQIQYAIRNAPGNCNRSER